MRSKSRPDMVAAIRRLCLVPALHPEHRVRPEAAQPVQPRPHGERPPARVDVLRAREVAVGQAALKSWS